MLAAGDQQKLQKAKTTLTNALIGFVIVFVSFWIVQIIGLVLGLGGWANIFGKIIFGDWNAILSPSIPTL